MSLSKISVISLLPGGAMGVQATVCSQDRERSRGCNLVSVYLQHLTCLLKNQGWNFWNQSKCFWHDNTKDLWCISMKNLPLKESKVIERRIELRSMKINTCIKWSKRRESIYIKVSHVHICIHVNHCFIDIIFIVCTSVCSSPVHMNVYSSPKVHACMLVK